MPSLRRLLIGVAMAVTGAVFLAAQDPGSFQASVSDSGMTTTAVFFTTLAGVISLLATNFFAIWRDARNRKWDLEDRMMAREKQQRDAEAIRLETVATAIELARVSNTNRKHLADQLQHNTNVTMEAGEKAVAAFEAANNFNEKLEQLRRELMSSVAVKSTQIDHIEIVSQDTNEKVTDLKEITELEKKAL